MSGRILVTGASGFVGTRLVEALRLGRAEPVRAMIHDPARAVRVARLDVELVRADLGDERSLAAALQGCDRVVHCAYGTSGSARQRRALTGTATGRLAELARRAGVSRFIHLSTAVVWGFSPGRHQLDETVPASRRGGHPYVDGKLEAERGVRHAVERGLPAVVLRPTNVYGPWAPAFTVAPVQALRAGAIALVGDGAAPSNTVYVDNLVAAILAALDREAAVGETFVVDDANGLSWRRLYDAYAELVGRPVLTILEAEYRAATRRRPDRFVRGLVGDVAGLARSPEAKALVLAAAERPALRAAGRAALRALPGGTARARRLRGGSSSATGAAPAAPALPAPELAALQTSEVRFSVEKARGVLGEPPVGAERALELTADWLRFARLS